MGQRRCCDSVNQAGQMKSYAQASLSLAMIAVRGGVISSGILEKICNFVAVWEEHGYKARNLQFFPSNLLTNRD